MIDKPKIPEPDADGFVRYDAKWFKEFVEGLSSMSTARSLSAIRKKCDEKKIDPYTIPEYAELIERGKQEAYESQLRKLKLMNADIGGLKQPMCPKCLNKGVIYTLKGEKGEIVAYTCSCQKRSEG